MSVSDLSMSAQDYLKVIWNSGEWTDEPITLSTVAERMNLRLSSVSDAVKKLAEQGLVDHKPYGAVTLTDRGERLALTMVRRHRLIESFLVTLLGYRWDQVHDEAERLEHAVSDFLIERVDELLGHPDRDPHGDPIPSPDGTVTFPAAVRLTAVSPGSRAVLERFSDDDPELLQHFADHGMRPGCTVSIEAGPPWSEAILVTVEGEDEGVNLGVRATDAVWVSELPGVAGGEDSNSGS